MTELGKTNSFLRNSIFYMLQKISLILLSAWFCTQAWGQQITVTGTASETKTKLPIEYASVALLRADSSIVAVQRTDESGHFIISGNQKDSHILKISQVGYQTLTRQLNDAQPGDTLKLGHLSLASTENMLNVATVSATLQRVEQKGDTTQFNAGAYRVPQGSTLQSLIKQLPGVEIDDKGKITWNGKEVKEFLINGKDFFKGDTETAMKNLPTDLVNRIKAYDKKSDYSEMTGVDDGEETTVLDISTKKSIQDTWVGLLDGGYGNHDRYTGRVFLSRFSDRFSFTAFGGMNNINDKTIDGGYHHRMSNGLVTKKNAGLEFSWENKKEKDEKNRLEIEGNINFNYFDSNLIGTTNSETFLSAGRHSSFQNSWQNDNSKNTDFRSVFRFRWNLTPQTILMFRPQYSYSRNRQNSHSLSATFNEDPYLIPGVEQPLDQIMSENSATLYPELYSIWLNANLRHSLEKDYSHYVGGNLNLVHKLKKPKRSISLQANGGYSTGKNKAYSLSNIRYNETTGNQSRFLNQYRMTPTHNYNYRLRSNYTEPFGKGWVAKLGYAFDFKHTESNRSLYNLDSLAYEPYRSLFPGYEHFGDAENHPELGIIPTEDEVLNAIRDLRNSQYATYEYTDHTASLGMRFKNKAIRFNADLKFNPERTRMHYNRPGQRIDTLITRKVFKVAPSLRFKYKFSNTSQLDLYYYGYSSQPSMTDLLAIVDDSNPLNINIGNPGLDPSWNNNVRVYFNSYNTEKQRNIMTGVYYSQVKDAVSNRMIYDEQTGIRYMRPENINGNWNVSSMFLLSSGIGKKKLFNISSMTTFFYNNNVGYTGRMGQQTYACKSPYTKPAVAEPHNYDYYEKIFASAESVKNTTRNLNVGENIKASYRGEWYEIGLKGRGKYQHARASVQDNANMDTWNFSYGGNLSFNFKFGLNLYTEIQMNSRRGYNDASMNTDELVWNAQISQSFLRNRAASLSIDFYDILRNQTNISRQLTATQRTDSWNNSINSFFMVRFTYQLNIFNGKHKKGASNYHSPYGGRHMMRMGSGSMHRHIY